MRTESTSRTWRTVDIVVTAAIAVAFGVVFWAWNFVWATASPMFAAVPPAHHPRVPRRHVHRRHQRLVLRPRLVARAASPG